MKTYFKGKKWKFWKKHGSQNAVAMVTSILTHTSRRLQDVPRQFLGKVEKLVSMVVIARTVLK